jgi:DNA-binding XRE family transcriptional regulator
MPLIQYYAKLCGISIVEFARIFGISKNHAEAVMKHRVFPTLELAVRIARYFEIPTDDLFAWRIDDDGSRRPLVVWDGKEWVRTQRCHPLRSIEKLGEHNGGNKG